MAISKAEAERFKSEAKKEAAAKKEALEALTEEDLKQIAEAEGRIDMEIRSGNRSVYVCGYKNQTHIYIGRHQALKALVKKYIDQGWTVRVDSDYVAGDTLYFS